MSSFTCDEIGADLRPRTGLWEVQERSSSITIADTIVFALIVALGALTLAYYQRSSDFLGEDVFYADCARSLLNHGIYGINGHVETNQPPGLPLILAALFRVFGYSYTISVQAMAVFETLGFLAAYELLRRRLPRLVAAAICVIFLSSPIVFRLTTREVWPCLPVFCTTMAALLLFEECERARSRARRVFCTVALTLATIASVMIASAAIALLGAFAVTALTFLQNRQVGLMRKKWLLPVVFLGALVQGLWMRQKPAPLEWPLAGYPASYLQQLKVKSGNHPELGTIQWTDIPQRLWTNAASQSDVFLQLVVRHGIRPAKTFVVIIPVLLIAAGWARSVGQAGESTIAWYFAGYELIYLLWPWTTEFRFFLPVAPLAALYLWRGLESALDAAKRKQRLAAGLVCLGSLLLGSSGWYWMYSHPFEGLGLFPDEVMAAVWWVLAICAAWVAVSGQSFSNLLRRSQLPRWLQPAARLGRARVWRAAMAASGALVLILIGVGIASDVRIARSNVRYTNKLLAGNRSVIQMWPEIEGGMWLNSHAPADSVVMARHLPTVYHYAHRKMVWFAPISSGDVLMSGIVRHGVDYVVVVNHGEPYYVPDDADCFRQLRKEYGSAFQLVFRDSNLQIFEVNKVLASRLLRQ